jgi:hypothetical protein
MARTKREISPRWETGSWAPEWKKSADRKKWHKSPSDFKVARQRKRRSTTNQILTNANNHHSFEDIEMPAMKRDNDWNWI